MSGEHGWLLKEFERAKERSEQVPAWARPVITSPSVSVGGELGEAEK